METRISFDVFQSVKRVAQACNPLMVKREKIKAKIEALTNEYESYDTQIASLEAGIKQIVGFRVEELVKKVIEPGIDANGQPKKTTKYIPTSIVSYDEEKKQFVVTTPDVDTSVNMHKDECVSDSSSTENSSDSAFPVIEENQEQTTSDNVSASSEEQVPSME